jgi:hypothetical protein
LEKNGGETMRNAGGLVLKMVAAMVGSLAVQAAANAVEERTQASPPPKAPPIAAAPASGTLVNPPSEALGKLLGPMVPAGKDTAAYDKVLLERGKAIADAFPGKPTMDLSGDGRIDVGDYLFYDLPLVLYRNYYRTNDPYWRDKAREAAKAWRDYPGNQKMAKYNAGEWKLWPELNHQPRCFGTLGMAVLALESNDAEARKVVNSQAKLIDAVWMHGQYQSLTNAVMPIGDPRECGYALMALTASTVLGDDHKKAAKELLDKIIEKQKPDGQWLSSDDKVEGGGYTSNFMTGILNESLVFYDRAIGDARIAPAIEKNLAWTFKTQWVKADKGFKYHSVGETQTDGVLGGLMVQAWGYAYAKTGKQEYLDQGKEIMAGVTGRGFNEIWGPKQYCQIFRSSPMYFGQVKSGEKGAAKP